MFSSSSLIVRPRIIPARRAGALALAAALLAAAATTASAQCEGRFLPTVPPTHGPDVGFNDIVHSLVSKDGYLYAGGRFESVDGVPATAIARWTGAEWQPVAGGMYQLFGGKPVVYTMSVRPSPLPHFSSSLIVGGQFAGAGGPPGTISSVPALNIASWADGFTLFDWDSLSTGLTGDCNATAMHAGQLYAGGPFFSAGTVTARGVASWNGSAWMAQSLPGFSGSAGNNVLALQSFGDQIVAAGSFNSSGLSNIAARTTSSIWQPLGLGTNGPVRSLTVFDGKLIAGGAFTIAGGFLTGGIASWDGSVWQPLGTDIFFGDVIALAVYNDRLYAAGTNTITGGAVLREWNGVFWSEVFQGPPGTWIDALAVSNGELIMGGRFDNEATESHNWARYSDTGKPWLIQHPASKSIDITDSVTFSAQPVFGYEAFGTVSYQWRRDGVPITDGPGGASPDGGVISGASGALAPGQAAVLTISDVRPADKGSYDCVISTPCGSGTSAIATLTVVGFCTVDFNQDGFVDFADYLEFLTLFDARDLRVDLDGDGLVEFPDYLEFLNHFDAGC